MTSDDLTVFRTLLLTQAMADELHRQSFALRCSSGDLMRYLLDQGLKSMVEHVPTNEAANEAFLRDIALLGGDDD